VPVLGRAVVLDAVEDQKASRHRRIIARPGG
jgi:hypothetical protein